MQAWSSRNLWQKWTQMTAMPWGCCFRAAPSKWWLAQEGERCSQGQGDWTMLCQSRVRKNLLQISTKLAYKKAKAALNSVSSELSGLEVVEGKVGRSVGPWQNEGGLQRAAGSQHGIAQECQAGCFEALQSLPWKADSGDGATGWERFAEGERTHWGMCCWAQESEESHFCHQEMGAGRLGLSLCKHTCLKAGLQKAYWILALQWLGPLWQQTLSRKGEKISWTKPGACWLSCILLAFDCWFDCCFLTGAVWLSVPQNQSGFKASALACLKKAWSFYTNLALWLLAPACLHWAWAMPQKKMWRWIFRRLERLEHQPGQQATKCQQHWQRWT